MKAIFWDNDGMLVDTERLYFRATQEVLATIGIPLTTEHYIDLFLVHGTGAWHLAAERGLSPSAIEQLAAGRLERMVFRIDAPTILARRRQPTPLSTVAGRANRLATPRGVVLAVDPTGARALWCRVAASHWQFPAGGLTHIFN